VIDLYKKNKFLILFLLRAGGIYLLWSIINNVWLYHNPFVDNLLVAHLIDINKLLLESLGYSIFTKSDLIGIDGSSGLIVSAPCNGLSLFVLFAGFIIAYPGNLKSKLWFIPLGLLIIDILNIIRILLLIIIVKYSPEWLEFNHSYTFTLIMYLIIFLMWMKFAGKVRKLES